MGMPGDPINVCTSLGDGEVACDTDTHNCIENTAEQCQAGTCCDGACAETGTTPCPDGMCADGSTTLPCVKSTGECKSSPTTTDPHHIICPKSCDDAASAQGKSADHQTAPCSSGIGCNNAAPYTDFYSLDCAGLVNAPNGDICCLCDD